MQVSNFKYLALFSAQYYPLLVLAKNWHFFSCDDVFYNVIHDEVGDFPCSGHLRAWTCEMYIKRTSKEKLRLRSHMVMASRWNLFSAQIAVGGFTQIKAVLFIKE